MRGERQGNRSARYGMLPRITELTHRVDSAELASHRRVTGGDGDAEATRRLTGKINGGDAAAASRRQTDGGRSRRLRRTAEARVFHARAEANLWEARTASSGLRLRRGLCLRLRLDERNTMVVLNARDDQWVFIGGGKLNVITAHGFSGDELSGEEGGDGGDGGEEGGSGGVGERSGDGGSELTQEFKLTVLDSLFVDDKQSHDSQTKTSLVNIWSISFKSASSARVLVLARVVFFRSVMRYSFELGEDAKLKKRAAIHLPRDGQ
uniref:Uncharacterized protein n=1 Tax=Brassica oleracea var. oleracea TaxID=109376 RepID=A0A0D3CHI3_BRAOL